MPEQPWLTRAAVLSVFDVDWLGPVPHDDGERLAAFLAATCERVVDAGGTPRWRLRDDERLRVLRGTPRQELLAALGETSGRPDEPVQRLMERYLRGTPVLPDDAGTAELAAVLQLQRWFGPDPALPAAAEVQSLLEWRQLLAPLRRLLASGFLGRAELIEALTRHAGGEPAPPFVVEGVGGSGKSTVLARLAEQSIAAGHLVCYAGLDRSWLLHGGPWSLFDELARQVALQLPVAGQVAGLRARLQEAAGRHGYTDIASRGSQRIERVPEELMVRLGRILGGRRLLLVLDTLEELARRDEYVARDLSAFLDVLQALVPGLRVVAAGRARPRSGFDAARVWPLTGLSPEDSVMLLHLLGAGTGDDELLARIARLTRGNPLSLHLAADVLRRTGTDPTRLIALGEGDIQGQLYSRLLEHVRDRRARAVAHPGLVVRRITPDVIRAVLAEPCGLAPLTAGDAAQIFRALQWEATLCEPSPDGDGALVHRPDVRAIMLPAIARDRPAAARAIHEAAVDYYEHSPEPVARREELYHRLMLARPAHELDARWDEPAGAELAAVLDELPPESQVYVAGRIRGLRLDPAVRARAGDEQWARTARPAAAAMIERRQYDEALALITERRGGDDRSLLPDLEIEALERLGHKADALRLCEQELRRASALGDDARVRDLIVQQARILERGGRFDEAWDLLEPLAALERAARARGGPIEPGTRTRHLVLLTSLLRIARHAPRPGPVVDPLRAETVALAEDAPARELSGHPSLLRDLAAEVGAVSPRIFALASAVFRLATVDEYVQVTEEAQGYDPW
ncbi:AAA family ATPase [Dactylosporangium sp. NPDC051485]|uniref:AAA family ATPase n=1 Tax=Dactylosporangium sp. NPDC051485 TaxID=3154846 RepID=UPI003423157B